MCDVKATSDMMVADRPDYDVGWYSRDYANNRDYVNNRASSYKPNGITTKDKSIILFVGTSLCCRIP